MKKVTFRVKTIVIEAESYPAAVAQLRRMRLDTSICTSINVKDIKEKVGKSAE